MWFRNIQVCQFEKTISYQPERLEQELHHHAFKPCTAVSPITSGFVPPVGDSEDAPLVYGTQGYMVFCMKTQQKLLPASVLREQHKEKVKALEDKLGKKISRNEKQQMKEELEHTLLSKAFSRSNTTYAYVDTHNNRLIIDSSNKNTLEAFYKLAGVVFAEYTLQPLTLQSPSAILTSWLRDQAHPDCFSILDNCSLEHTSEQKGKARFSKIDLYSDSVQSMLTEGSRVTGLSLNWADKMHFTIKEDFSIASVKFLDEIRDLAKDGIAEGYEERFAADFFIMAQTIAEFLIDVLPEFIDENAENKPASSTVSAEEAIMA